MDSNISVEEGPVKAGKPQLLVKAPDADAAVFGGAYYTKRSGVAMACQCSVQHLSDIEDEHWWRWSEDNGRTWTDFVDDKQLKKEGEVRWRRACLQTGIFDPCTNRCLSMETRPLAGAGQGPGKLANLTVLRMSGDGESVSEESPVIQEISAGNEKCSLEGVLAWPSYLWKSYLTYAATPELHFLDDGSILWPMCYEPLGPDGKRFNPYGWDFGEILVMIGQRKGGRLAWRPSAPVKADPELSTRGWWEPALARLAGGRVLMVLRAGNYLRPDIPCYKWYCISGDGGFTWTSPKPWAYSGGEVFFSPSSISRFIRHSAGRTFWVGNISPNNPSCNAPRYPLVIGELDTGNGLLKKETVAVIADRAAGQHVMIEFSNFGMYEDRGTGEIVIDVCHCYPSRKVDYRKVASGSTEPMGYKGDLYRYRVEV